MAAPKTTTVVRGVLTPSKVDADKILKRLQQDVATNPKIAQAFQTHPRATLSAYGLNLDAQHELLRDAGMNVAELCIFTDCIHTCWFTKCYVTHIVITKD